MTRKRPDPNAARREWMIAARAERIAAIGGAHDRYIDRRLAQVKSR